MSETNNLKGKNKAITYMVYGTENEKLTVRDSNEQPTTIPGIPMEIPVDTHSFEIGADGTIYRLDKNGTKMQGKVTNKNVIKAIQGKEQSER